MEIGLLLSKWNVKIAVSNAQIESIRMFLDKDNLKNYQIRSVMTPEKNTFCLFFICIFWDKLWKINSKKDNFYFRTRPCGWAGAAMLRNHYVSRLLIIQKTTYLNDRPTSKDGQQCSGTTISANIAKSKFLCYHPTFWLTFRQTHPLIETLSKQDQTSNLSVVTMTARGSKAAGTKTWRAQYWFEATKAWYEDWKEASEGRF